MACVSRGLFVLLPEHAASRPAADAVRSDDKVELLATWVWGVGLRVEGLKVEGFKGLGGPGLRL